MAGLRTPLSRIQQILEALNDGLSVNATCRTFHVSKNTIRSWQDRLSPVKDALLLYALCHQFLHQVIEGDELYTKVHANQPPADSPGWTIVLMDRASRFIWDLSCGERDRALFEQAMQTLAQVVQQTDDLALLTDGERRYGNVLFDICQTVIRTGQRGRPRHTLPEGIQVRVKNKGSQAHRRGPKRPKYQAPNPNIPRRPRPLPNRTFMLIMWKPSTPHCGDGWPVIGGKPIPMQKTIGSNVAWMSTGSCTTSCARISRPSRCQRLL